MEVQRFQMDYTWWSLEIKGRWQQKSGWGLLRVMHRSIHVIINNYIIVVIPLKMAQDFLDVAQRNRLRHNISADNPYICRPCARSYKCRNFHQALHFNICASCKSLYICAIHQVYSFTKAAKFGSWKRHSATAETERCCAGASSQLQVAHVA